ncbi:MAG TPA: SCO family protein [Kiritimatiellia bacterium]|nr:SCO family protein [Kiritimatiellia bacterium]
MNTRPVDARVERVVPTRRGGLGQAALPLLCCVWALLALCAHADSCCASKPAPASEEEALPLDSVYQLESTWTNSTGAARPMGDLRGPHRIVVMFYASCTYACPMLVADLKKIEARLPAKPGVVFTLFSFDDERDTPAALAAFAERQGIGAPGWELLTGPREAAREMAAVLGVRYRKESGGAIAHSNEISLLDGEGRIVARLKGLNEDPQPILEALARSDD